MKGKNKKTKNSSTTSGVVGVLQELFNLLDAQSGDRKDRFLFPNGIDYLKAAISVEAARLELELKGPARATPSGVVPLVPDASFQVRQEVPKCAPDESEVTSLIGMNYPQAEREAWRAGQFHLVDCDGNVYPPEQRRPDWFVRAHCPDTPQPGDCHNTGGNLGVELERQHG